MFSKSQYNKAVLAHGATVVGPTIKGLNTLPFHTLISLGSETLTVPKPKYVDLDAVLERGEDLEAARTINRGLYREYMKVKSEARAVTKEADNVALAPFKQEWVLPQLMAFFGNDQCRPSLGTDGQVDVLATLKALVEKAKEGQLLYDKGTKVSQDSLRGMISFLKYNPRGSVLPKGITQTSPNGLRFNTCVPLLMSAWKASFGIEYSRYNYDDPALAYILEDDLIEFLQGTRLSYNWTTDELTSLRNQALYIKSTGGYRTVNGCTTVYSTGDTSFDALPKLIKLALLQLWVFQPTLYKSYMLHSLTDTDAKSAALVSISTELFAKEEPTQIKQPLSTLDLGW